MECPEPEFPEIETRLNEAWSEFSDEVGNKPDNAMGLTKDGGDREIKELTFMMGVADTLLDEMDGAVAPVITLPFNGATGGTLPDVDINFAVSDPYFNTGVWVAFRTMNTIFIMMLIALQAVKVIAWAFAAYNWTD